MNHRAVPGANPDTALPPGSLADQLSPDGPMSARIAAASAVIVIDRQPEHR
ncbi:hypothetical protein [Plantactinospora mayteni]|uniref:hypothetical protein n=1 Tax=Plantactinospora mayteni TaxID=566021 RepID=UPI001944C447|nr:hypothetical protein [Plantactinospora mayteni]